MAARLLPIVAILTCIIWLGGCGTRSTVATLPPPNFNGPMLEPPPAPKPVARPKPAPPAAQAARPQSGPREWMPRVRPRHWQWIVVHHSATPSGDAARFDKMHREKGWDELGYHFVIGNGTDSGDGEIEVGSRWPVQKHGAHAKTPDQKYNNYGIGICLVGNFAMERPTQKQMQSLARLTAHLMSEYDIPASRVVGHSDTGKATECPGRYMDVAQVRQLAKQAVAARGQAAAREEHAEPAAAALASDRH